MKKILVTGENSYIGKSFKKWARNYPGKYFIEMLSLRNDNWEEQDFSKFDVILHVAGIAHTTSKFKESKLYYEINRDLTVKVANKAKAEGVSQFIFMSSIIVYGDSKRKNNMINDKTAPSPSNSYGKSKIQAEEKLKELENKIFKVAIIRTPMVYGENSKGNYPKLAKLAKYSLVFPNLENKRSMVYIKNLCEFIRILIDRNERGVFFPQNREHIKTSNLVKKIAEVHNKKIVLTRIFNPFLKILFSKSHLFNKIFGNLAYDLEMSGHDKNYIVKEFEGSIIETEIKKKTVDNIDILLVADNNLDSVGGEQESTKIIIDGVKSHYSVGVIQPGVIKNPKEDINYYLYTEQTRIKHLIKYPWRFFKYIFYLKSIINKKNPSVVHTQAQASFFIISALRKLKLVSRNSKFVHTERGLHLKYSFLIKRVFYFFMKELDTLVTTTEFNMNGWKKAILSKRMDLRFKIIENTAGELFESYKPTLITQESNKLVIGFAGRYCDWKNWPLALEIVKGLEKEVGDQLFVKMAVGCLDENSKVNTLKMFTELKKLMGERFEGKINVTLKEMNDFYYNIDFFILTSKPNTESFGRTLVEAMSRGVAVLTTNSGGSVEVVGDNNNVCHTSSEFIERILKLQENKNNLENEKTKNMKRVSEKYSLSNNINKHLELYKDYIEY